MRASTGKLLLAAGLAAALACLPASQSFAAKAHSHHAPKAAAKRAAQPQLTVDAVNDTTAPVQSGRRTISRAALLHAQILLDRAHFSPGEMDAAAGSNMKKALIAFQQKNELPPTGTLDEQTWTQLIQDAGPALTEYTITAADAAGPFVKIPPTMPEKALLPAMGYSSPAEALGERFHIAPKLLQQLNPGKDLGREGEVIAVPNVGDQLALPKMEKGARVIVSKSNSSVTLVDAANNVVAWFPASTGSAHDPLPLGEWKINGVSKNPKFHYNPQLFWDAKPDDKRATIPPGPNNPVGVVWIDLSKPHYGIHGTPEPSMIGKTQSHGCIRMTNWDAWALAQAVHPGMAAVLVE